MQSIDFALLSSIVDEFVLCFDQFIQCSAALFLTHFTFVHLSLIARLAPTDRVGDAGHTTVAAAKLAVQSIYKYVVHYKVDCKGALNLIKGFLDKSPDFELKVSVLGFVAASHIEGWDAHWQKWQVVTENVERAEKESGRGSVVSVQDVIEASPDPPLRGHPCQGAVDLHE